MNQSLLILLTLCISSVHSQHFEFQSVPIPEPRHILSLYRFFSYTLDDPPPLSIRGIPIGVSPTPLDASQSATGTSRILSQTFLELDGRQLQSSNNVKYPFLDLINRTFGEKKTELQESDGQPEVSRIVFDNLRFTGPNAEAVAQPGSVEVSVLSYSDFWNVFFPTSLDESKKFCCDEVELQSGRNCTLNQLIIPPEITSFKSVPIKRVHDMFDITSSDMFILLFSNCGLYQDVSVSGAVYLHNYFGYLPGIEAPKVGFYLLLASVYVGLLIVWAVLALRHRSQLIHIHMAIAVVLIFGLLEALWWFGFYRHWNSVPQRSTVFLGTSIVVTVIKNILAFMLVLVASLGWGITKPSLGTTTKRKIYLLIMAYVIFDSAR